MVILGLVSTCVVNNICSSFTSDVSAVVSAVILVAESAVILAVVSVGVISAGVSCNASGGVTGEIAEVTVNLRGRGHYRAVMNTLLKLGACGPHPSHKLVWNAVLGASWD